MQQSLVRKPRPDNTSEGLAALIEANLKYRSMPWPTPFDRTSHRLCLGDARTMEGISDETIQLIVTSPPYWTLKDYSDDTDQLGAIDDYEHFLAALDQVWSQCERVLVPGGRICCVVGDVCVPRKKMGRHHVVPLHADIQVRSRRLGLDCLTPVLWHKISNGVTEANGNGAGYYGKPYQPGGVIKNDMEYILFLRKVAGTAHPRGCSKCCPCSPRLKCSAGSAQCGLTWAAHPRWPDTRLPIPSN